MRLRASVLIGVAFPLASCVSVSPSSNYLPKRVPASVLVSVCSQVGSLEGLTAPTSAAVATFTDPSESSLELFALWYLCTGEPAATPEDAASWDRSEKDLVKQLLAVPVEIPRDNGLCHWKPLRRGESPPKDTVVLRLSSPIPATSSPCGEVGLFAAYLLKGVSGADWYWVPLERLRGSWVAGQIRRLPISD